MFEDELLLFAIFQHDRVFVVALHLSANSCAIQQVNGHMPPSLNGGAEKRLLNTGDWHEKFCPRSGSCLWGEEPPPLRYKK